MLDGAPGKAVASRLWVRGDDRHVVFGVTPTKHGSGPAAYLRDVSGIVLTDGGSEFNEAVRKAGRVRDGCWSRTRRTFHEARDTRPAMADEAIARIEVLFEIERQLQDADPGSRCQVRSTRTRAVLNELHAWLTARVHGLRPTAPSPKP